MQDQAQFRVRRALLGVSVLASLFGPAPFARADAASPPDLGDMLKRLDALYTSTGSTARAELTVETPRQTRTLQMRLWSRGEDHALVVIEAPARERGTATLRVEDNLWNYLPRISRTIRVPPSMMLSSWMGSDFTNDDLVHESSYRHDFDASWKGRSENPAGFVLELVARPGVVGRWARIEMVIRDDGKVPLAARYYDRHGRLARTMRFDDVRDVGGTPVPMRLTLTPEDDSGHRTVLHYLELNLHADVPESTFSLSNLERSR